ncbi:MAG TPA: DUF1285 domain-containing protein [Azospirillaceae bacterium]|nr:DUF1285 domain-containing protein [Azospirillaceae bacterium]HRQ82791.1 DUF1285 domain-containing protein [Azospirillaceae bacterium]
MTQTLESYDIRILRDGTWLHEGEPIRRLELVKLFSRVLRRDAAGDYWLITPAERGRIMVEDAPFIAVEMTAEGQGRDQRLSFRTNVDDWVTAGPDHPITTIGDAPYVEVRGGLTARLARSVYYQLAELATDDSDDGEGVMGVWSEGTFFALSRPADATAA